MTNLNHQIEEIKYPIQYNKTHLKNNRKLGWIQCSTKTTKTTESRT